MSIQEMNKRPSSSFKFRGKRVDNGEIVEGYYDYFNGIHWIQANGLRQRIHPDSVEQLGRPSLSIGEIEEVLDNAEKEYATKYKNGSHGSKGYKTKRQCIVKHCTEYLKSPLNYPEVIIKNTHKIGGLIKSKPSLSVEEWISVEDRLPEDGIHIQLYRPEIQFVGWYKDRGTYGEWVINAPDLPYMIPAPTHWQPLLTPALAIKEKIGE